ncbi:MAG TPA: hypothetical protein VKV15_15500 [Bryobacteraceae bacterium]|nr:hypothetical protein [Bryobacteraceae bacterium]
MNMSDLQSIRHSIGFGSIAIGLGLVMLGGFSGSQMRHAVNRAAPSDATNPLKNLYETFSSRRVRGEYARLFPDRAPSKIFWTNVLVSVGMFFFVAGIILI